MTDVTAMSYVRQAAYNDGFSAARNTPSPKEKALAAFIAENWHHCPVDENITIKDCCCWGGDHCTECLVKHATKLK